MTLQLKSTAFVVVFYYGGMGEGGRMPEIGIGRDQARRVAKMGQLAQGVIETIIIYRRAAKMPEQASEETRPDRLLNSASLAIFRRADKHSKLEVSQS